MMRETTETMRAKLDALLEEYRWLGSDQQLYTQSHRGDAQIFLALLGSLLALSQVNQALVPRGVFFLMIPSIIFVYYMMQALNFNVVTFESKQRAKIEQKINDLLRDDLLGWEATVARAHLRKPTSVSVVAGTLIFGLLLLVFCLFSYLAYAEFGVRSAVLHVVEFLCMAVVGVLWFTSQNEEVAPNPRPQDSGQQPVGSDGKPAPQP